VRADGDCTVTVPVVGRISMDQMMVDRTDVGVVSAERVDVGTPVELMSADRGSAMHVSELARQAGIEPYVFLTGLSSRITRRYRNKIEVPGVSTGAEAALPGATPAGNAVRDYPAA
jgi:hypothetical protein